MKNGMGEAGVWRKFIEGEAVNYGKKKCSPKLPLKNDWNSSNNHRTWKD